MAISSDKNHKNMQGADLINETSSLCNYNEELTEVEMKIMSYIRECGSITNKEARSITELSSSGVRKIFERLTRKKLIVALGDNRSRYYKLFREVKV